jgi:hypothetical protein
VRTGARRVRAARAGSPEHGPGWHAQLSSIPCKRDGGRGSGGAGAVAAAGDAANDGDGGGDDGRLVEGADGGAGGGGARGGCSVRLRQDAQGRLAAGVELSGGAACRWSACADWDRGPWPGASFAHSLDPSSSPVRPVPGRCAALRRTGLHASPRHSWERAGLCARGPSTCTS